VSLPAARYAEPAEVRDTILRIVDAVRVLPGVEAAGVTTSIPMGNSFSDSVIFAEGYHAAPGESLISPSQVTVSEGYAEAMGMRLVAGRWFDARDADRSARTVIVDEVLARKFWPDQDPLGRRMYMPESAESLSAPPAEDQMLTVVGVAGSLRLHGLDGGANSGAIGAYYFPFRQYPDDTVYLAIRTGGDPARLASSVRQAIAGVDAGLPFFDVMPMGERVERSLADRRTPMALAIGFAAVALFLFAIGLYGVLAYQVAQRRREIGIRMALGAGASNIVRLVVTEGAAIVVVGAALGLAGAALLRPVMTSQLYMVGALDPWVITGGTALMAVVALAACLLPARRAARTDPAQALADG
jgi:predicted permease